jgi:hypothetical protein
VTQDHDLELPLTASAREHANDAAQEPIQQTRQHDAQSEPISNTAALAESNFFTPQANPSARRVSLNRFRGDHQHRPPEGIEFLYPTRP